MADEEKGFYVAKTPSEYERVIVKDGQAIDLLELLVDTANKVERAGLK